MKGYHKKIVTENTFQNTNFVTMIWVWKMKNVQ